MLSNSLHKKLNKRQTEFHINIANYIGPILDSLTALERSRRSDRERRVKKRLAMHSARNSISASLHMAGSRGGAGARARSAIIGQFIVLMRRMPRRVVDRGLALVTRWPFGHVIYGDSIVTITARRLLATVTWCRVRKGLQRMNSLTDVREYLYRSVAQIIRSCHRDEKRLRSRLIYALALQKVRACTQTNGTFTHIRCAVL